MGFLCEDSISLDTILQEDDKPLHFWVTALARETGLSTYTSFQPVNFTTMNSDGGAQAGKY